MKSKLVVLALLLQGLVITGCSQKTALNYDECNYPDSPSDTAPGWVCEQPVKGLEIQGVGYSRKLLSGPGMMTDVATTEARNRLAAEFSQQVEGRLERLTRDDQGNQQTKGKAESTLNSRDVVERIQKTLTSMTLTHSKIYRTQISPAGGMYVLVGLDKQHYDENIDQLVKNSLNNQDSPQLYQQFLKSQTDESLDKVRQQLK